MYATQDYVQPIWLCIELLRSPRALPLMSSSDLFCSMRLIIVLLHMDAVRISFGNGFGNHLKLGLLENLITYNLKSRGWAYRFRSHALHTILYEGYHKRRA